MATMTLNFSDAEMAVVDGLADQHEMSKTAVMRTALRLYQLVNQRLAEGETFNFSGDQGRAMAFVGVGFPLPTPPQDMEEKP